MYIGTIGFCTHSIFSIFFVGEGLFFFVEGGTLKISTISHTLKTMVDPKKIFANERSSKKERPDIKGAADENN